MTWNVFVVGYDDLGKELLPKLNNVEDYHFHGLLPLDEVVFAAEYEFDQLVEDARRELDSFSGTVDAIVGYWDFPTSALLPVLREKRQLPGPSLEAVLKCEHKYWSRLEQQKEVNPSMVRSLTGQAHYSRKWTRKGIPLNLNGISSPRRQETLC